MQAKTEVTQNVKAMCMHRIGSALVATIDSLVISSFIGVVVLGMYSNYILIATVIAGTIALFFSPLTSVIGHLCAAGDVEKTNNYFNRFYVLNYILGVVFFLGYFAVIDYVVTICFGAGLEMSREITFIITLNQFTQFMRKANLLFRDASGAFYHDRWKPVAEGVANLILSLLFVHIFPEEYKVVGVIVATIITTLLICDIVEPFVIFKHVFNRSPRMFYVRSYSYIALFIVCLVGMSCLQCHYDNSIVGLLVNGSISLGISNVGLAILSAVDKGFRRELFGWFGTLKGWILRKQT